MEHCKYKEISNNSGNNSTNKTQYVQWKPFLKQVLICSGVWTSIFVYGLGIGAPTVFIPQIRREANSTNIITEDMASWISSAYSFSAFPCVLILSIATKHFGRKLPFIIATADSLAAFIVLYYSSSITHILISAIMQGFFSASQIVISIVILTEYTSPRYRGIFLMIKSATMYWGIWASNAIGTFFHWKIIPLFGIVCVMYSFMTTIIWPESPYWLASKGRFKECAASHRWLKGCNEESESELEVLINSHKEYINTINNAKISSKSRITVVFETIKCKEFYKPTLIAIVTGILTVFSGKLICAVYALDIIKKITENETTAYVGMLTLDGVTVFSMYIGCTLARFLKRRTLLLVSSSIGVTFLLILSLYLYLIKIDVFIENNYVTIALLSAFSIAVSCGPLIMSVSVYAELIPIRSRNLSVCCIALLGKLLLAISLKSAPFIFNTFGLHGLFLIFGICSLIIILILYVYLPETKDKTLHEITDSMKG